MARQMLDRRHPLPAVDAIRHLVGLQAQEPHEPYVGLWSRLEGFRPPELVELLESKQVVRTLLMRRTIHLVTAEDCLRLRGLHQPMREARVKAVLRRDLEDGRVAGKWTLTGDTLTVTMFHPVDPDPVVEEAEKLLGWHGISGRTVLEVRE